MLNIFKIESKIIHLNLSSQGQFQEKLASAKEFYHLSYDEAIRHINSYIQACAKSNIFLEKKETKNGVERWETSVSIRQSFYVVELTKINVRCHANNVCEHAVETKVWHNAETELPTIDCFVVLANINDGALNIVHVTNATELDKIKRDYTHWMAITLPNKED